MADQNVIVLGGSGNVGREFLSQVIQHDTVFSNKHLNPTNIIALTNSKGFWFNKQGLKIQKNPENVDKWKHSKEAFNEYMQCLDQYREYDNLAELLKLIDDEGMSGEVVFVDVTSGKDDLRDFHLKVINDTEESIVTANKNPLSIYSTKIFRELTRYRERYGFRCTVMAGANAVSNLLDYYDTSEIIKKIEACFSGTLGYLCTELEKGERSFSQILNDAKKMGYTEPHPKDDLNGRDVARKLIICARTFGHNVSMSDIDLEGFIDESFLNIEDVTEFMESIKDADQEVKRKFDSAKSKGKTLRYVANFNLCENGDSTFKVGLREVSPVSPLGILKGSSNKVIVETDIFNGDKKYIIESPGAGPDVTAWGLRRELLSRLRGRKGGDYKLT
jgi:aspartokinase/homoserine dehydrogenase 1